MNVYRKKGATTGNRDQTLTHTYLHVKRKEIKEYKITYHRLEQSCMLKGNMMRC